MHIHFRRFARLRRPIRKIDDYGILLVAFGVQLLVFSDAELVTKRADYLSILLVDEYKAAFEIGVGITFLW